MTCREYSGAYLYKIPQDYKIVFELSLHKTQQGNNLIVELYSTGGHLYCGFVLGRGLNKHLS